MNILAMIPRIHYGENKEINVVKTTGNTSAAQSCGYHQPVRFRQSHLLKLANGATNN